MSFKDLYANLSESDIFDDKRPRPELKNKSEILDEKHTYSKKLIQNLSHTRNQTLSDRNVAKWAVKMIHWIYKAPDIWNKSPWYMAITSFFSTLPAFWHEINGNKYAIGSLGFGALSLKLMNKKPSSPNLALRLHLKSIIGLHFFILKIAVVHKAESYDDVRLALSDIFISNVSLKTWMNASYSELQKQNILSYTDTLKWMDIYIQWANGIYSDVEAIRMYEFIFKDVVTPIFIIA